MSLDFVKMAWDIIKALGGENNIVELTSCALRLRFVLKDESVVNDEIVKSIDGVKGVIKSNDQYQILIGNEIAELICEFVKMGDFSITAEECPENIVANVS